MAKTPSSSSASPWIIGLLAVIVVTAVVLMVMNRFSKPSTSATTGSTQNTAEQGQDVAGLVARVSKHIVVKTDEQPSVATVQDPNLLRAQNPVFYQDAQAGDRLLVWSDKAVLYSPARDIILAVMSIRQPVLTVSPTSTAATSSAPPAAAAENATVEVRNGSGRSGLAKSVAEELKGIGLTVLTPANATISSSSTLIVAAPGKELSETVQKLVELLRGKVAKLPAGEAAMKSDVLVIVGSEYRK